MSGLGKVIVVQRDRRAQEAMRLGFEREGAAVVAAASVDEARAAISGEVGLIVAGASGHIDALEVLGGLATATEGAGVTPPVLYVGNGATRAEAWELGASEVLDPPTYLRDVVTVGKLLAGSRPGNRAVVHGELGDTYGVFYLIRAIAATGRSGVLFLARGLRRGEIRFYAEARGPSEVTSAQIGGLHGQAAMHQLLLWTEARFEFRHELVVRRRQIPMDMPQVLADAERFLLDIREMAAGLSPSAVFEQDVQRMQVMARKIPTEVHGVLRLFDGNRTVADVLEDGPYRVFETLRVAQRAIEAGLLRRVETAKPKAAQRAVLAVEEWLVGTESKEAVLDRLKPSGDTGPVVVETPGDDDDRSAGHATGASRRRKKKRRGSQERPAAKPPAATTVDIDWGALVPRASGADLAALSTVVPSTVASGEIVVGSAARARRETREGLEALTDAEQRDRLFPTETVKVDDSIAKAHEEDQARARAAEREAIEREGQAAAARAAAERAEREAEARRVREAAEAEQRVARAERERAEQEEAAARLAAAAAREVAARERAEREAATSAAGEASRAAVAREAAEIAARLERERAAREAADWAAVQKAAADKAAADKAAAASGAIDRTEPTVLVSSGAVAAVDLTPQTAPVPAVVMISDEERASMSRENSGEIRIRRPSASPSAVVEAGPSILIDDLAAAHAAATAAVGKAPHARKREPTPPPTGGEVASVRADAAHVTAHATHFTEDEENFFKEGAHPEFGDAHTSGESFHDLDEGYQPQTFWERLTGKKPQRAHVASGKPPSRGGGGGRGGPGGQRPKTKR